MGHYSRECPNLPLLSTKENVSYFIQRFSAKKKGKIQIHLIKSMNEEQEKAWVLKGTSKFLKM
jgi:hypothetical protein